MGLFKRIKDVTLANINDLIDRAEDPEKMIEQYLRDMGEDLRDAESAVSKAIANRMKFEKLISEEKEMVDKRQHQAIQALEANKEDLARRALEDKNIHQENLDQYQAQYDMAKSQADKLQHQLREMKSKYDDMKNKKDMLKARAQSAKAQKEMNDAMSGINSDGALSGFERMEDKVNQMEAQASASESMLDENRSLDDELETLGRSDVNDELAALKAQLNKEKEKA